MYSASFKIKWFRWNKQDFCTDHIDYTLILSVRKVPTLPLLALIVLFFWFVWTGKSTRTSHKVARLISESYYLTSLASTFCFPISDHVMFSREFSFCFLMSYLYKSTRIRRYLKETVFWSNITWSEMGKQKVQAKEANRPFPANDHMVQNPPCWRASSLLFPHWDIKTKASQAWLVQVSLF